MCAPVNQSRLRLLPGRLLAERDQFEYGVLDVAWY
jgi:hypothetical protein